jgi:hypothetical protein
MEGASENCGGQKLKIYAIISHLTRLPEKARFDAIFLRVGRSCSELSVQVK